MNSIYTDNQEICLFINRAQNKLADLTTLIVNRGAVMDDTIALALELIDFLETIDSPYFNQSVSQVLTWIHEYSYRANLNELAYLNLVGFTTTIKICECGEDSSSTVTEHNSLNGLQGGNRSERYHLTKEQYDKLISLLVPTTPPVVDTPSTVGLVLTSTAFKWPSGYYELGASNGVVNLKGSIAYGTNKQALYYEYQKNSLSLGRNSNPAANSQPNEFNDSNFDSTDITYSFVASFSDGLKTATQSIAFRQPMYSGVIKRSLISGSHLTTDGIKNVRDRGEMSITFDIPIGNTELSYPQSYTPFLFIPKSWGKFTSAMNLIFEFVDDWTIIDYDMPLANGTTAPGLLATYEAQIEGLTTFKFNW